MEAAQAHQEDQKTFQYQIPDSIEPGSFVRALNAMVPGAVLTREGRTLTLKDIQTEILNTQSAIDSLIDPAQAIGDSGDCGSMDSGDI